MGGVISKYPDLFRRLAIALYETDVEVCVLSDMSDRNKLVTMLRANGFDEIMLPEERILQADYVTHGEMCKRVVCEEQDIVLLIDDHPGYVASGNFLRLLAMPDQETPYYHDTWKALPGETFGRVKPHKSLGKG